VAATITSPDTSPRREDLLDVLDAVLPAASISRRDVGHSCACTSPPRQRSAPAVRHRLAVPPIPIARWSFVPRIAAEIAA
jgi:hypothetical protein